MTGVASKWKRLDFEWSRGDGDDLKDVMNTAALILWKDSDSHCDR